MEWKRETKKESREESMVGCFVYVFDSCNDGVEVCLVDMLLAH